MNRLNVTRELLHGRNPRQDAVTAQVAVYTVGVVNMGMFESLVHYFVRPVLLWILAIFVIQAFFWPMATTWAGDMLAMFWTQAIDEVKDLFW